MAFLFGDRKLWLLVVVLCVSELASCGKILILHPLYSGSHVLTLSSVAESLTQRGHQIHIVRWKDAHIFPAQNNPNITTTTLAMDNSNGQHAFLTSEKQAAFQVPFDILWNSGLSAKAILDSYRAFPLMGAHCETLLGNKRLFRELQQEKFDLAIIDILYNECGLALLHQLRIPSVGYWAFPFASGEADYTTAFLPSSHVPTFLSKQSDQMTFWQRLYNTLLKAGSHLIMWIHCSIIHRAVQSHYPGSPHPFDLLKDMNGMLINTDYSLDYPRLLPPTFVNVGGMQIRNPRPLPKEIESWMESSGDHGVILFTMGFIFNPSIVPKKLINAFMKAFSRFPQKFLMKFDGHIDHIPANVKVLSWIPQQDVLAHSRTKVFLTHCGLHGVMEAIYYGVPMVGMPIFIDQGDVLIKMKDKGIAVGFHKENTTAEEIYAALKEVIDNPKYKHNIQRLSHLMRDVKESPLERATELLEYIMRHHGAEHLKLSSRHLNFFQYFCIDTILFLLLLIATVSYIQFRIWKQIFRFFWNKLWDLKFDQNKQIQSQIYQKLNSINESAKGKVTENLTEFSYGSVHSRRQFLHERKRQ
ncbi:unnamed protein product [Allacma fusca]|uniref:UDP-glycosyltransferases domain-containing protein n=1 Tax=Allacma fusca TaxID=39272 RepID=A0A8J2LU97_9HEXA|nr:unnamed protein product [Allacma fusca]